VALFAQSAPAQQRLADASATYASVAPSVFLVERRDNAGKRLGIGSAFLISGNRLVTNAHVVSGGRPFLKVGPIAIELTIARLDTKNDLAILESRTPVEARPLLFGPAEPGIGTPILALGNPQGLERTVTEGLISGVRTLAGRRLLQISASISPGSSGGPVVTSDGLVVGVVVGFLENGQNLNFAIPSELVQQLLSSSPVGTEFDIAFTSASRFSEEESAPYTDLASMNARRQRVTASIRLAGALASTGDQFWSITRLAVAEGMTDEAIRYAEAAIANRYRDADHARRMLIVQYLIQAIFADSFPPATVRRLVGLGDTLIIHKPSHPAGYRARAEGLLRSGRVQEALPSARKAVSLIGADTALRGTYWSLYHRIGALQNRPALDDSIFAAMDNANATDTDEWSSHARHLEERTEWNRAADAWAEAFALSPTSPAYACEAGENYWIADKVGDALAALRTCVEQYSMEVRFDTATISIAHQLLAAILNSRGVYPQAEMHARQSLILNGRNYRAALELSRALLSQKRPTEAVGAAELAIRESDGADSEAHFALGDAYFDLQDWSRSETAFRKADQLDPKGTAAAYNVALCLARQGYFKDAAQWMEVVLKRDPTRSDRARIGGMIRMWRSNP